MRYGSSVCCLSTSAVDLSLVGDGKRREASLLGKMAFAFAEHTTIHMGILVDLSDMRRPVELHEALFVKKFGSISPTGV